MNKKPRLIRGFCFSETGIRRNMWLFLRRTLQHPVHQ